jgi:hypothetical protein
MLRKSVGYEICHSMQTSFHTRINEYIYFFFFKFDSFENMVRVSHGEGFWGATCGRAFNASI